MTFTSVGVLSGDPLHIFMPPLRISLLLLVLVPLPYISMHGLWMNISKRTNPSSSSSSSCLRIIRWYDPDTYWRHPSLRNVVILLQRITPSAIAAGCLALNACGIGWYTLVQKTSLWRLVGKYSFQGWVAWLAVVSGAQAAALSSRLSMHTANKPQTGTGAHSCSCRINYNTAV